MANQASGAASFDANRRGSAGVRKRSRRGPRTGGFWRRAAVRRVQLLLAGVLAAVAPAPAEDLVLVRDLDSSPPPLGPVSSAGSEFMTFQGELYFQGCTGFDCELWKTDGSMAGTSRVADIVPWASRIARVPAAGGPTELVLNTWAGPENVALVHPDAMPPGGPTAISSTSHAQGGWTTEAEIVMAWSGATDGGSGVAGYSVLFDELEDTEVDDSIEVAHTSDPHGVSSGVLADGSWYFHLSACDQASNCSPTVHRGPYGVDTGAPGAPGAISSSSHDGGAPTSDATVDVTWGAATDPLSGIDGFSYFFDPAASSPCETTKDVEVGTLSATSAALVDGTWYSHVCAVDNAGNWGAVTHGGPYVVDTTPPTGLMLSSSSHSVSTWSNDSTIDFSFSGATDIGSLAGYSVLFDEGVATEPGCAVTQAGSAYEGVAGTDGDGWWLHVRAVDLAGNCGAAAHLGPFWIDTESPSALGGISSPTHGDGLPKLVATVEVTWTAATDAHSGVAGYRYEFLDWSTPPPPCGGLSELTTGLGAMSAPLSDGSWYLAICAHDTAGNDGPLAFGLPYVVNLEGTALTVFWANWAAQATGVVQVDGTGYGSLPRSLGPLMIEVDLAGGRLYWSEYWADGIFRSELDHDNEVLLGSGLSAAHGLALDLAAGYIYFTQRGTGSVSRMNLDGSDIVDLVTGLSSPHDVELDLVAGKIYWADEFAGTVQRANLDGSGVETLASGQGGPTGVALDLQHGQLFWTERSAGRVDRSALDGSGAVAIVTGLSEPLDVDYVEADGRIYFTEVGADGWLRRSNDDGSGLENLIPFGGSPEGIAVRPFFGDSQAPGDPTSLVALAPHVEGGWTSASTLTMEWFGALDEVDGSGLSGYSIVFDTAAETEPDATVEVYHDSDPHEAASVLSEGLWYFHLVTCDLAGNCGSGLHRGPYGIDQTAPPAPENLASSSHIVGVPSGDDTVDVEWTAPIDALSGVAGYGWSFSGSSSWVCDETMDGGAATLTATSNPLSPGDWWFHVCAVDGAGNWGSVADLGPFTIDTTGPQVLSIGSVAATSDGAISQGERLYFGPTQLLVRFDEPMNIATVEDLESYRLVEAGDDGLLQTTACEASPSGDDDSVVVSWAVHVAADESVALGLQSRVPLEAGRYRLLACAGLEDLGGNPLQAAPFARDFDVESTNLLANPNLDGDLGTWQTPAAEGAQFGYSNLDADGIGSSGSALSSEAPVAPVTAVLSQCLPGQIGAYVATAAVRASGSPTVRLRASAYSTGDCSGPALDQSDADLLQGATGGIWTEVTWAFLLPPGSIATSVEVRGEMPGGQLSEIELDRSAVERALFGDGFETGDSGRWTLTVP